MTSEEAARTLQFRLLGPLEARVDGRALRFAGGKQRALLCVLLVRANEAVSTDVLVEALWPGGPPARALNAVQVHVSGLRKLLGPAAGRLETHRTGYVLTVEPGELDSDRFAQLVAEARTAAAAGEHARAAGLLRNADGLWYGEPLADVRYEPFAQAEIARLEELRLIAREEGIEAELVLGRAVEVVAELEALVAEHPLRERLRAQLMLALYRGGRQAEALAVYQDARRALVDELGIDPSPPLRELEAAILRQDEALELEPGGRVHATARPATQTIALAPRPQGEAQAQDAIRHDTRKVVTVLFCDLADSSRLAERLDPEALRGVMSQYFAAAAHVIKEHGGTVEKFIGDAVMAVFGIPRLHEDDALRAVRAAVELRDALVSLDEEVASAWGLRLAVRIGLNTGEVIVGGSGVDPLVTGEAVTNAARLEQAAAPGQILLGEATHLLVRHAVLTGGPEQVPAKGRRVPLAAFALEGLVTPGAMLRFSQAAPLVGRERELGELQRAFASVAVDGSTRLVLILGAAGVGKSRLTAELIASLGEEAFVLAGRCLPYGEGMTLWPVLELLRRAAGLDEAASADDVVAGVAPLVAGEPDADRLVCLLGELLKPEDGAATSEETFWALRRFLETLARSRPLVVVLEDIHWAEPTLLDLVEYIRDWTSGTPLLLICLARRDFLERRPAWSAGRADDLVFLDPLDAGAAADLLERLRGRSELPAAAREAIMEAAEGNPLFLEQMLTMVAEREWSEADVAVPPTIHALLAARLDALPPDERAVIDRAAVMGRTFSWEAVRDLLPDEERATVGPRLAALVRKELISADLSAGETEHVFRFRHLLIREAAYAGLPKESRAALHARTAERLERRGGEHDELVGYHLEQTVRYRLDLGLLDESGRALARRGAERLGVVGRQALARGDIPAAAKLLERAAVLHETGGDLSVRSLLDLGVARREFGDLAGADAAFAKASELGLAAGDERARAWTTIERSALRVLVDGGDVSALREATEDALRVFERTGDDAGIARAWRQIAAVHWSLCQCGPIEEALERALLHAERAGDEREIVDAIDRLVAAIVVGPTPAGVGIERCLELRRRVEMHELLAASIDGSIAVLVAMQGDAEEARRLAEGSRKRLAERASRIALAALHEYAGMAELVLGDADAAEQELRAGYALFERMGEQGQRSTMAALLARALYAQERFDEAARFVRVSAETAADDDLASQVIWRAVDAKLRLRTGDAQAAERLGREAVARVRASDFLNIQADTLSDLADVLDGLGRAEEAAAVRLEALDLYVAKGNRVAVAALRATPVGLDYAGRQR